MNLNLTARLGLPSEKSEGNLILLAARPGAEAFFLSIVVAYELSVKRDIRGLIFSWSDLHPKIDVLNWLVSMESGIDLGTLKEANYHEIDQFDHLKHGSLVINNAPLKILSRSYFDSYQVKHFLIEEPNLRELQNEETEKIEFVIMDQISFLVSPTEFNPKKVSEELSKLKEISLKTGTDIIVRGRIKPEAKAEDAGVFSNSSTVQEKDILQATKNEVTEQNWLRYIKNNEGIYNLSTNDFDFFDEVWLLHHYWDTFCEVKTQNLAQLLRNGVSENYCEIIGLMFERLPDLMVPNNVKLTDKPYLNFNNSKDDSSKNLFRSQKHT